MKQLVLLLFIILVTSYTHAQKAKNFNKTNDSLYINEIENLPGKTKVLHAEPLFIDLIRDLGARKGEKEWNIGLGLTDNISYDAYSALIEYEWAPIDRLGLEIELPITIHYPLRSDITAPGSKLNSLKLAAQYTFLVSENTNSSLAVGYIHEFELQEFVKYKNASLFTGNVFNPFFIAAKRWGNNFHTLLYTGPAIIQHFSNNVIQTNWQINSNLHYMIPGTRNFIGIEFNKSIENADFDMTIRPQMRVGIKENLLVGIVTGIPVNRENERFSSFIRLIYEPGHKSH
jgi:hypothetical protein